MNLQRLSRPLSCATVMLALSVAFSSCSSFTGADKTSSDVSAKSAPSESLSFLQRKLVSITEDQNELFDRAEKGDMSEEDFERKILHIVSRYDELISGSPNDVDLLILYGKFLRRINQNERADRMFFHADQLDGNIAVVKQQLGNFLAEQGNYAEALAYYMRAVELDPEKAVYHYGIGELLATFRDKFRDDFVYTEEVLDGNIIKAFSRAAELEPENKDFCFRLGEAYYDLASPRWEDALAYWDKAAERDDLTGFEKDVVRLHRARVLCEMGRLKESLKLLHDNVAPFLSATRTRLMKRITEESEKRVAAEAEATAESDESGNAEDAAAPLAGAEQEEFGRASAPEAGKEAAGKDSEPTGGDAATESGS